jgi:hypothetical protein
MIVRIIDHRSSFIKQHHNRTINLILHVVSSFEMIAQVLMQFDYQRKQFTHLLDDSRKKTVKTGEEIKIAAIKNR